MSKPETVGEWQNRKKAQAERFMTRDPSLSLDNHGDHETRFVLVHQGFSSALKFGQLPRRAGGQPRVDLTDDEIEAWAAPLRRVNPLDAPAPSTQV